MFSRSVLYLQICLPKGYVYYDIFARGPVRRRHFLVTLKGKEVSRVNSREVVVRGASRVLLRRYADRRVLVHRPITKVYVGRRLRYRLQRIEIGRRVNSQDGPPRSPMFQVYVSPIFVVRTDRDFDDPVFVGRNVLRSARVLPNRFMPTVGRVNLDGPFGAARALPMVQGNLRDLRSGLLHRVSRSRMVVEFANCREGNRIISG